MINVNVFATIFFLGLAGFLGYKLLRLIAFRDRSVRSLEASYERLTTEEGK